MSNNKEKIKVNPYRVTKHLTANVDSFTSDFGIKFRGKISPILRKKGKSMLENDEKSPKKIIVERPLSLSDDDAYIFASTHGFPDDIIATICSIDRHAYLLTNSVDQLMHNPDMKLLWLNGMIFVNTRSKKSRGQAVPKMVRILNYGTSIIIYPEGSWNVTENIIVNKLFNGIYLTALETKKRVVPIGSFHKHGSNEIYISFGEPFNLHDYSMQEGLDILREKMATLKFELIEKYGNKNAKEVVPASEPAPLISDNEHVKNKGVVLTKRESLPENLRKAWLEEKKKEVLQFKWVNPDWEDEYLTFKDKNIITKDEVWEFVHQIQLNKNNARLLQQVINERQQEEEYDLVKQLIKTWKK